MDCAQIDESRRLIWRLLSLRETASWRLKNKNKSSNLTIQNISDFDATKES